MSVIPPSLEVLEAEHARLTAEIQAERLAIAESFRRIQALVVEADRHASILKERRRPAAGPPPMPIGFYTDTHGVSRWTAGP
jgi:hypothetical protein